MPPISDEFPPLTQAQLELSADPAFNRPHTVRMALELIEARKRLKRVDEIIAELADDEVEA